MLTFPNAKINIGLYITQKRADGYHNLETVFYPVPFRDALELVDRPGEEGSIALSGLAVAGDREQNLVWRAFQLLQHDFSLQVKPLQIFLHKVIPMGAGMGGGSSDAAFMLRMMNEHFQLGLDTAKLESYALKLGSDCPFFIRNLPAFAAGRGELLEPLSLDLSTYNIQIICPSLHVSTAEAFSGIKPSTAPFDLRRIGELAPEEWRTHIHNSFEDTVMIAHPVLQDIKAELYAQGAIYASMSGSGSALYGIFPRGRQASIGTLIPHITWCSHPA
ncbi:4-(cytidine 5'-diphospho)-2-C-methyl-D-erythritol kinase [Taibaiella koreensis]|uniref:4-(cytidine 5'-diphospho)-2-C-methyl-D-erythritol kinase n=1 Tax=Taibaiella koreensis TaxID=1268548 RepID=UPI000E59C7DE|nr:4-(cytidine 5'-diphospho)-2-C-methyl-D-erythritol kinase [Taibaiella koreensis]